MSSLASLVLKVDATSVGAATTSLNQLAAAGTNAQAATTNLTAASNQANSSILANQQAWFSNANAINSATGALTSASGAMSHLATGFKTAFFGASIAVGLVGLKNQVIALTESLIEAQVQADKLRNGLNFAVGRSSAAADLVFIKKSAQELGLSFGSASEQYIRLAVASRQTSLEGQKTKDIFTAIAKASTVMGLSADETTGALRSITQMISKGTVMSEELKGQLGERLPGALQIAARALNVTTKELSKMLELGQVMAEDFLPKFAAQLSKEVAPEVEAASHSLQASLNRLATAWTMFKQSAVSSGIGESLSKESTGLANYITVLYEAMDRARASGVNTAGQWAVGLGTAIARIPFDTVNVTANTLNKVINGLSLGFLNLSTNVNVLPQMFETASTQSDLLAGRLAAAESDLAALTARLERAPDNIYLKDTAHQAYLLVQQLRSAQNAMSQMPNQDNYASGSRSRGASLERWRTEQENNEKEAKALIMKSAGWKKDTVAELQKIQSLFDAGALSYDSANKLATKTLKDNFKPEREHKAAAAAAKYEADRLVNIKDAAERETELLIRAADKRYSLEISALHKLETEKKALLESAHSNKLMSDAAYEAQYTALIQNSADKELDLIDRRKQEKVRLAREQFIDLQSTEDSFRITNSWRKDSKGESLLTPELLEKRLQDQIHANQKIAQTLETELEQLDASSEQIRSGTELRVKQVADKQSGWLKGLIEDIDALLRAEQKLSEKRATDSNRADTLRYADPVTTTVLTAQWEAFDRITASTDKYTEAIRVLEIEQAALNTLMEQYGGLTDAEVAQYNTVSTKIAGNRVGRQTVLDTIPGATASAGQAAADKLLKEEGKRYTDTLTDAAMTGIFDGVSEGGKKARAFLDQELFQRPFKMVIQALVQPYAQSLANFVTGGVGQVAGQTGGSMLGSAAGSAAGSWFSGSLGSVSTAISEFGTAALASTQSLLGMTGTAAQFTTALNTGTLAVNNISAYSAASSTAATLGSYVPYAAAAVAALAAIGVFRTTKTTETGIMGTISAGGSDFSSYHTTRKSGYLFGGPEYNDVKDTTPLAQKAALDNVFNGLYESTTKFATALGLPTDKINEYTATFKVNTIGLSAADAQAKVTEALTAQADAMAKSAFGPALETYQLAGESYSQTLTRMAEATTTVDAMYTDLGASVAQFGQGLDGANIRSQLIEIAGGMDAFKAKLQGFYDNFYTDAERQVNNRNTVRNTLTNAGVTFSEADISSVTSFKNLVLNSFKDTSEAGLKATDTLLGVQNLVVSYTGTAQAAIETTLQTTDNTATAMQDAANKSADTLSGLQKDYANLEIESLEAQGKSQEALTAQRKIDIETMDEASIQQYDRNEALKKEVESLNAVNALKDDYVNLEVELLQAQGKRYEALSLQRQIDIKDMDAASVAQYNLNQARKVEIENLNAYQGTFKPAFNTPSESYQESLSSLTSSFASMGITLPAATVNLRSWYKSVINSSMAANQGVPINANATASLLALQSGIEAVAKVSQDTADLEEELSIARGKTTSAQISLQKRLATAATEAQKKLMTSIASIGALAEAMKKFTDKLGGIDSTLAGLDPKDPNNAQLIQQLLSVKTFLGSVFENETSVKTFSVMTDAGVTLADTFTAIKESAITSKDASSGVFDFLLGNLTTAGNSIKDLGYKITSGVVSTLQNVMRNETMSDTTKGLAGTAGNSIAGSLMIAFDNKTLHADAVKALAIKALDKTGLVLDLLVRSSESSTIDPGINSILTAIGLSPNLATTATVDVNAKAKIDPVLQNLGLMALNETAITIGVSLSARGMSPDDVAAVVATSENLVKNIKLAVTTEGLSLEDASTALAATSTGARIIRLAIEGADGVSGLTGRAKDLALFASDNLTSSITLDIQANDHSQLMLDALTSTALEYILTVSNGTLSKEFTDILERSDATGAIVLALRLEATSAGVDINRVLSAVETQAALMGQAGNSTAFNDAATNLFTTSAATIQLVLEPGNTVNEINQLVAAELKVIKIKVDEGASPEQIKKLTADAFTTVHAVMEMGAALDARETLAMPIFVNVYAKLDRRSDDALTELVGMSTGFNIAVGVGDTTLVDQLKPLLDASVLKFTASLDTEEAQAVMHDLLTGKNEITDSAGVKVKIDTTNSQSAIDQLIVSAATKVSTTLGPAVSKVLETSKLDLQLSEGSTQKIKDEVANLAALTPLTLDAVLTPGDTVKELDALAYQHEVLFDAHVAAGDTKEKLDALAQDQTVQFTAMMDVAVATEIKATLESPVVVSVSTELDTESAASMNTLLESYTSLTIGATFDSTDVTEAKATLFNDNIIDFVATLDPTEAEIVKKALGAAAPIIFGTDVKSDAAQEDIDKLTADKTIGITATMDSAQYLNDLAEITAAKDVNINANLSGGEAYKQELGNLTAPVTQHVTIIVDKVDGTDTSTSPKASSAAKRAISPAESLSASAMGLSRSAVVKVAKTSTNPYYNGTTDSNPTGTGTTDNSTTDTSALDSINQEIRQYTDDLANIGKTGLTLAFAKIDNAAAEALRANPELSTQIGASTTLQKQIAVKQQGQDLADELFSLTASQTEIRAKERLEIDATNKALYDRVNAIKDERAWVKSVASVADTLFGKSVGLKVKQQDILKSLSDGDLSQFENNILPVSAIMAGAGSDYIKQGMTGFIESVNATGKAGDASSVAILDTASALYTLTKAAEDAIAATKDAAADKAFTGDKLRGYRVSRIADTLIQDGGFSASAKGSLMATMQGADSATIKDFIDSILKDTALAASDVGQAMLNAAGAMLDLNATLDGLVSEGEQLSADLMTAQGDTEGAAAAIREMATKDMTALEAATWDANEALKKQIAILNEAKGLNQEINNLLGNTAALRAAELEALDPANRAIKQRIYDLQDADKAVDNALSAVQRAIDAEKTRITDEATAKKTALQDQIDLNTKANEESQKLVDSLKNITDGITEAVKTLRGTSDAVNAMNLTQARAYIDMSLSLAQAGIMPDEKKLQDAIKSVTADDAKKYRTKTDYDRAQLLQANKLEALGALTGGKLTSAEAQLKAATDTNKLLQDQIEAIDTDSAAQLKALDAQLKAAQDSVSVLRGIDISVVSVKTAIDGLTAAMASLTGARTAGGAGGAGKVTGASGPESGAGMSQEAWDSAHGIDTALMGKVDGSNSGKYTFKDGILYSGKGTAQSIGSLSNSEALAAFQKQFGSDNVVNMGSQAEGFTDAYKSYLNDIDRELNRPITYPGLDIGTNYVPGDMNARIHEGEAIIPKAYNPAAGGQVSNAELREENAKLRAEMAEVKALLKEIAVSSKDSKNVLVRVSRGGTSISTNPA